MTSRCADTRGAAVVVAPEPAVCGNTAATAASQRAPAMSSLFFTTTVHLPLPDCAACAAFSSARAALRMLRKP